jgi:hypothetical protein
MPAACEYSILLLIFSIVAMSYAPPWYNKVLAVPPIFLRQEMEDGSLDFLNVTSGLITDQGSGSLDIVGVNYLSDGKVLTATIWLHNTFKRYPNASAEIFYGMLVDSDFNNETGLRGGDHRLIITWENKTKTWTRMLEELSSMNEGIGKGEKRTLSKIINYSGFYEQNKRYVNLTLPLHEIDSPDRYRIIFYTEEKKDSIWNVDFTNWVNIPPPSFNISIKPNPLVLVQGEHETVDLQINSSAGLMPTIYVFPKSVNGTTAKPDSNKLPMPSYGVLTIPVHIDVSYGAPIGTSLIPISVIATYPSESTATTTTEMRNVGESLNLPVLNKTQNVAKEAIFLLKVNPAFNTDPRLNGILIVLRNFSNAISPHVLTISTLIAIFTSVGTGIYAIIKWAEKNKKKPSQDEDY